MHPDQMSIKTYKDTFPTVVQNDLINNNRIYGVPYSLDNLILFYNTKIFEEKKIKQPPRTLQELADIVPILTDKSSTGQIVRSAINLGGTDGVPRMPDILAALMMQYGVEMTSADHTAATFNLPVPGSNPPRLAGEDALSYYTQFAQPSSPLYTFNDDKDAKGNRLFPSDLQAFMEGKLAMFIGYGYNIKSITKFAPKLKFETTTLPQQQLQNPVTVAGYWAETVSKNSQHANEAWDFINYMSERTRQNSFSRLTNTVVSRKDLLVNQTSRRFYGAVAKQVDYSKSWYRKNTLDIENIFTQMVNNVVKNSVTPNIAIETAVRDINNLR
jgi:multiple sugar transport system substrate-binding protein